MKNIVLTGFMGAGKSSVGKKLAEKLDLNVIDTDEVVERDSGQKISDIFKKQGEAFFRALERQAVERVSHLENTVIITGGGVVLDKNNIKNLRRRGVIVYLHATPEVLHRRVKSETHRPLLQVENPRQKIKEMLKLRAPYYGDNDITIDTTNKSVEEVVNEILKNIHEKMSS
jgi:shikimate kinase